MPRKATTEEKPKPRARRPKKASLPAETEGAPVTAQPALDHAEIARLAHSYWLERGGQGGSAEEDWQRAENALKARSAGKPG
jgi:hypothetical protein